MNEQQSHQPATARVSVATQGFKLDADLSQLYSSLKPFYASQDLLAVLIQVLRNQAAIQLIILDQGKRIMATLADIAATIAAEKTIADSIKALVTQVVQQLHDLVAQIAALTPNQVAIDALAVSAKANADELSASVDELTAAVHANTTP